MLLVKKSMMYKISIITINLNDKIGLEKTIKSVVSQTYISLEFLIIDGASTDGSLDVIETQKEHIHCLISEKDSGIYNAMNKGIQRAKGDYLLFLNSGDILTSNTAIEDFVTHTNFNGDIIYGDYKFKKGEKIYPDTLTPFYFLRTSLPHQSTFFKKEVFETMGLYDESLKIASDRAFYIKSFLSNQIKFQHVNYALTLFDLEGLSNNAKHLEIKRKEDTRIFKEYYGSFYNDYIKYVSLEQELSKLKRKSLKGVLKRLKKRLYK
ncbi:glycosyltransferase family 2 protein [Urechidicola sp. KH5]